MTYTTKVDMDYETGEYYIQLPNELIKQLGWNTGTDLEWVIEDNVIILKEKINESSQSV